MEKYSFGDLFEKERIQKLTIAKNNFPYDAALETMGHQKTKDILHVMRVLGHKSVKNTLRYIQLVDLGEQDFVVKVAWTLEEAVKLLEGAFNLLPIMTRVKSLENPNSA